jgi:hypothetical protein
VTGAPQAQGKSSDDRCIGEVEGGPEGKRDEVDDPAVAQPVG